MKYMLLRYVIPCLGLVSLLAGCSSVITKKDHNAVVFDVPFTVNRCEGMSMFGLSEHYKVKLEDDGSFLALVDRTISLKDIREDELITFRGSSVEGGILICHTVIKCYKDGTVHTKGINNMEEDYMAVSPDRFTGVVIAVANHSDGKWQYLHSKGGNRQLNAAAAVKAKGDLSCRVR